MPICVKCGTVMKESDNFCKECGAPKSNNTLQISNTFPTERDINDVERKLASDESFRLEYVKYYTGRRDITSDNFFVKKLATDHDFRLHYIEAVVHRDFLANTKCSELPLDWKRWPNLILIEDAYSAAMADSIAAFIKRTQDDCEGVNSYYLNLICMDPSKSWVVLKDYVHVSDYTDDAEEGSLNMYGVYGYCKEELDFFASNRYSDLDEYMNCIDKIIYRPYLVFIDDFDLFIQKANDSRLMQLVFPYLATYAKRTRTYLILGSKIGSRSLGSLKSQFTIKTSSEFAKMCKGEYSKTQSTNIDVNGYDFEQYCADLLLKNKYNSVEVTKKSGDQGIDVLAERDGVKYAIQCKYYTSPVGNNAVQEAYSGKTYYKCHVAVVMTNNTFSDSARQLAEHLGVVLWDGNYLSQLQK